MKKKIIVIKGSSATGKGTRVVQFIEWLRTMYEPRVVEYSVGSKTRPFGLAFDELKLFFVGQYTVSNKSGLASWTSMDTIHATTGSGEIARSFVKDFMGDGFTMVCEGEPLMQSDKWRPVYMREYYGVDDISIMYFSYPSRVQYDERVVGRSGKKAGDSGWSRNESYPREFEKSKDEMIQIGFNVAADIYSGLDVLYQDGVGPEGRRGELVLLPYDAPLNVIGRAIRWLAELNTLPMKEFEQYCIDHPMTRTVGGADPLAHRVPEKVVKPAKAPKAKVVETPKPKAINLLSLLGRKK